MVRIYHDNWNWIPFKIQDMKAVNFSIRTWEEMRILSFYLSVFSSFLHFKKKAILCQVKRKEFAILRSVLYYLTNKNIAISFCYVIKHTETYWKWDSYKILLRKNYWGYFWVENTLCIPWRTEDFDHERTTCIKKGVQQKSNILYFI